jgi:hypothetical protein
LRVQKKTTSPSLTRVSREARVFLTNDAGRAGYPYAKE